MGEKPRHPAFFRRLLDGRAHLAQVSLVEVDDEEERFGGEELKAAQPLQVIAREFERAQWLSVLERRLTAPHQIALLLELRRASLFQILFDAFEPAFGDSEIRQNQLVFHRLRITGGVDRARRVRHALIAERMDDVHERIGVLVPGHVHERLRASFEPRR